MLYDVIMAPPEDGHPGSGRPASGPPASKHPGNGHPESGDHSSGDHSSGDPGSGYSARVGLGDSARPRWQLCVAEDGQLKAVLTGSEPLITVSGDSLASLRKQMRNAMLRGLL